MQNAGQIVYHASIDTSQFKKDSNELDRSVQGSASNVEKSGDKMSAAMVAFKAAGIGAAIAVGAAIVKNLGGAISRVDTLDNSGRIFENLGFGAEETADAMMELDGSIRGLPTRLNDAVLGVQTLAASSGDIGKGQKIYASLNNAVLGLGGTSQDVDGAVLAMSRAIDANKLQGREWQMLITAGLGPALTNLAKEMGLTTNELQEGLSDGTISVEGFEKALLDANDNGAGSMASFQKMAQDSTAGISTSWQNMQTAIVRGIANLISAIGTERIASVISNIGKGFEAVLNVVSGFVNWVITNWPKVVNAFNTFWQTIKPLRDFIANQFKAAWDQITKAINDAMTALDPYTPQLKQLGIIIGVALIIPLGIAAAAIVAVVVVGATLIAWIARAMAWFSSLGSRVFTVAMRMRASILNAIGSIIGWFRTLPQRIVGALGVVGLVLRNSGVALIRGFLNGIKSMVNAPITAVRNMASKIRNLLPFSPAKEGPFSGSGWVDKSGMAIADGLASGMIQGTRNAVSAAQGLMTDLSTSLSPGMATVPSMASGGGSGQSVVNNINRIDIANEVDGENWLKKLGREEEIIEKGLTRG